jgi:metal-dependent hydrolase (beta-lactamase superfamily II)
MEISVIASGSNGNSCLVENKGVGILIDAGKSGREIEARMNNLGKSIENVKGIVLTHSHSDHVSGAGIISRKYGIPVYMAKETYKE